MHVFENNKIWDAANSTHLHFWASKLEFVSDPHSRELKQSFPTEN